MQIQKSKSVAQQISEAMVRGAEQWVIAGNLLAIEWRTNPGIIDEVCDLTGASEERVICFLNIGLKKIHVHTLLNDSPGVRRLRKCPYELQEKFSTEPLDVAIDGGSQMKIDANNLTQDQAKQVFDGDKIRTIAAQRAFIEDRKIKLATPPANDSGDIYRVRGHEFHILSESGKVRHTINKKQMFTILAQMEG